MKHLVCCICMLCAPLLSGAAPSPSPGTPAFEKEGDEQLPASRPLFPDLEKRLADAYVARPAATFAPPTPQERKRWSAAFALLLTEATEAGRAAPSEPVRTAFEALGFVVETLIVSQGDRVWGVFERPERRRGAGAYLVRPGPDATGWMASGNRSAVQRVVIMAPHPRADRGTELMAQRLFGLSRARALIQSTIHRRTPAPDGTDADPAHRTDTYFQAATEVLDARIRDQIFLQLHGFEVKRHGDLDPDTAVILSDGNPGGKSHPRYLAAAAALRARQRSGVVALWGTDTKRLGGTTNAQARSINPRGKNTFMHVEMSAATRAAALLDTAGLEPPAGTWTHSLLQVIAGR